MKTIPLHLFLTLAMLASSPLHVSAQVHRNVSKGKPEVTLHPNGSSNVRVEGFLTDQEAAQLAASAGKAGTKAGPPSPTATKGKAALSRDKEGKVIRYGCWRMQNNLKVQSDSMMRYFSYGEKPHHPSTAGSGSKSAHTIEKPAPPSILQLNPANASTALSVVRGAPYAVQVAPFVVTQYTPATLQKISSLTSRPVILVQNRGKYQLLIEGFPGLKEASATISSLSKIGFHGTIVRRALR